MSNLFAAADAIKRWATLLDGMTELSDVLNRLGSLEVATNEKTKLYGDIVVQLASAKAELDSVQSGIRFAKEEQLRIISLAKADAEAIINAANVESAAIIEAAKISGKDITDSIKSKNDAAEDEFQREMIRRAEAISDKGAHIASLDERIASRTAELNDIEQRVADLKSDLFRIINK